MQLFSVGLCIKVFFIISESIEDNAATTSGPIAPPPVSSTVGPSITSPAATTTAADASSSPPAVQPPNLPQRRQSGGVPAALQGSIGPHGVTGIIVGPGSNNQPPMTGPPKSPIPSHVSKQVLPNSSSKDFLSNMGIEFNDFAQQTSSLFSDIFGEFRIVLILLIMFLSYPYVTSRICLLLFQCSQIFPQKSLSLFLHHLCIKQTFSCTCMGWFYFYFS